MFTISWYFDVVGWLDIGLRGLVLICLCWLGILGLSGLCVAWFSGVAVGIWVVCGFGEFGLWWVYCCGLPVMLPGLLFGGFVWALLLWWFW